MLSKSRPPRKESPVTDKTLTSLFNTDMIVMSKVPPPKSNTRTLVYYSNLLSIPYAMAAATGSLMMYGTSFNPAILHASFVACN